MPEINSRTIVMLTEMGASERTERDTSHPNTIANIAIE